jgi:1-aminocyclopropane-1-carboxylate deaminase/D-cysteine desulfhydrase-like pyridoxal-dependent ACC family enzyme
LVQAAANGCDTLVTADATQSNHCRAVAILGAQLSLKVYLLLRADVGADPVSNPCIDLLSGATVNHYPPGEYSNLESFFVHWSNHYLDLCDTSWVIHLGGSNATGLRDYRAAIEELKHNFEIANINSGIIIHAIGSGGIQANLIAGVKLHNLDLCVHGYAVCDDTAYFDDKIHTVVAT